LKEGILLEIGFDDTTPNMTRTISSWALDKASESGVAFTDNRAIDVPCYHPGYTLVEKLQTVSTKFRQQQQKGDLPPNFLRHYYDISQLLDHPEVTAFIGTPEYHARKRFEGGWTSCRDSWGCRAGIDPATIYVVFGRRVPACLFRIDWSGVPGPYGPECEIS